MNSSNNETQFVLEWRNVQAEKYSGMDALEAYEFYSSERTHLVIIKVEDEDVQGSYRWTVFVVLEKAVEGFDGLESIDSLDSLEEAKHLAEEMRGEILTMLNSGDPKKF